MESSTAPGSCSILLKCEGRFFKGDLFVVAQNMSCAIIANIRCSNARWDICNIKGVCFDTLACERDKKVVYIRWNPICQQGELYHLHTVDVDCISSVSHAYAASATLAAPIILHNSIQKHYFSSQSQNTSK